jgi:hypothetical protein
MDDGRETSGSVFSFYLSSCHQSLVWLGTPHDPPDPCQVWTPPCPGNAACHPANPSVAEQTCIVVLDSLHAHAEIAPAVVGAPLLGRSCNSVTGLRSVVVTSLILNLFNNVVSTVKLILRNKAHQKWWTVSG